MNKSKRRSWKAYNGQENRNMAVRGPLTTGHACDGITNLAISLKRTVKANGIVCVFKALLRYTSSFIILLLFITHCS